MRLHSDLTAFRKRNGKSVERVISAYWDSVRALLPKRGLLTITEDFQEAVRKETQEMANLNMRPLLGKLVIKAGDELFSQIDAARNKADILRVIASRRREEKAFDSMTSRVVNFLTSEAEYFEVAFDAEMIANLQTVLTQAAANGWSTGVTERALRSFVGLTPKQSAQVSNQVTAYIADMIEAGESVAAANLKGELFAAQRGRQAEILRRETIARTEIARAYNFGQQEAVGQAVEAGIVKDTMKVWTTSGDNRVRDSHAGMEGESVPIDQPFSNGSMYPEDINERCWVEYEVEVA